MICCKPRQKDPHTWAEIETKPLISIYIQHFFPFFKKKLLCSRHFRVFLPVDIYCSARCVCPRMNMAFIETYIAHCNKQRSLPKKYMLMTLKQNISQRKNMGERVQEFNRSFRKIKFFTIFRWLLSQIKPIFWHPAPNVHGHNT